MPEVTPTPTRIPSRDAHPTNHPALDERLKNTIVNLVYQQPRTAEDLRRVLKISSVSVKHALEVLIDERRVYETRSRRKTTVHAVVLRGVTTATPEEPARRAALKAAMARTPHRKFTLADLARATGEAQEDTLTLLNTGILAGWVDFVNIGALRVYGLHPDHVQR